MNENPAFTQALQDLGMTRTEAEVYLATLQTSTEEPVSGYKVAQVMGRDPANLSKTLAHLVKVGAVRLVQARPRHYVGVPVSDFTEMLLARMEESREKAITLMASLGTSATTQQPIPLENSAHILAQARRILSQSRGNVTLCCDGQTLNQLSEFLQDMGRNFPDLALVLTDSPKEIPGIQIHVHNGPLPMRTGFADNTCENWLLITANSGQWLSAFFDTSASSENTRGWTGTNFEISLPFKTVLSAFLGAIDPNDLSATKPLPQETTSEPLDLPIADKLDEIERTFEAGAMASISNETSMTEAPLQSDPSLVSAEQNDPLKEGQLSKNTEKGEIPLEEGFKFLVQHEDDDEENQE